MTTSECRWVKDCHRTELINLWHLSRTMISPNYKRYERLNWATKRFAKEHPEYQTVQIYKDLDCLTR